MRLIISSLIFSLFLNLGFSQEVPEKNVEIVLGIDKILKLDFPPSTKIQVGNESILATTIIPQKREITLKAIKPGKTSVTIRNTVGDVKIVYLVNITANDQSKVVQELKEFLGDIEGLEIGIKGNSVFVGGQIIVPNDIGKVAVILEKYPKVIRLVELSPQTQRVVARKMQEEIHRARMNDVTVKVVNGKFVLDGVVTSNADRDRAEQLAQIYVPPRIQTLATQTGAADNAEIALIQNFIQVNKKSKPAPIPKMVKIKTQFVELLKDYNKIFGFKWEPRFSTGNGAINIGRTGTGEVGTQSSNTLAATIENLFPKLASAKGAGYARIIQSGIIVVKDKVSGKIFKKEDTPYAIGSNEFTKSEKATAGFDLQITPTILQGEKVELNIGLSVSATAGDPPSQTTNNISTSIIVKSKESAVAGGIVVNKSTTDFDRNPPGDKDEFEGTSPLFSFIKSKSHTATRSQFVVFVTPEIVESASEGTEEIRRKFRGRRR